jgi:hypothetical protein
MKLILRTVMSFYFAFFLLNSMKAQETGKFDFERIEDNSFLLEEAYNQEPGVIQHISAFQYMENKTWLYTFTEEWPVPGQKHQLSVTVPVLGQGITGAGDILLNYRYQAIFTDRLAFSPRFSFSVPTGNYKNEMGTGVLGYQVNLPLSFICSRQIVTHYNLGATFFPNARDTSAFRSALTNVNYGASFIWLILPNFNFMLEVAGNTSFTKPENAAWATSNTLFVNPGFRFAINVKDALQIVPGLSVPIGVGPSNGELGIFAYLSFEHILWRPKK